MAGYQLVQLAGVRETPRAGRNDPTFNRVWAFSIWSQRHLDVHIAVYDRWHDNPLSPLFFFFFF